MMSYGNLDLSKHWLGNGLLPDGTKALPELTLSYHQLGSWFSPEGIMITISKDSNHLIENENSILKITSTFPMGQWVNLKKCWVRWILGPICQQYQGWSGQLGQPAFDETLDAGCQGHHTSNYFTKGLKAHDKNIWKSIFINSNSNDIFDHHFAHAMAAELSWYVQNYDSIELLFPSPKQ